MLASLNPVRHARSIPCDSLVTWRTLIWWVESGSENCHSKRLESVGNKRDSPETVGTTAVQGCAASRVRHGAHRHTEGTRHAALQHWTRHVDHIEPHLSGCFFSNTRTLKASALTTTTGIIIQRSTATRSTSQRTDCWVPGQLSGAEGRADFFQEPTSAGHSAAWASGALMSENSPVPDVELHRLNVAGVLEADMRDIFR
jgi:hypothetical protein